MTGPIDPIRRISAAGRPLRPDEDGWEDGEELRANLPAVIEGEEPEPLRERVRAATPQGRRAAAGAYDAQVLGQDGVKRGLRGGQEVLNNARSTYLNNEFSGPNDRRPPKGVITKKEI